MSTGLSVKIPYKKYKKGEKRNREQDCPFRNIEEARIVLQHFLSKGVGSQLSKSTAWMGKAVCAVG
jgi:hypothetical protein